MVAGTERGQEHLYRINSFTRVSSTCSGPHTVLDTSDRKVSELTKSRPAGRAAPSGIPSGTGGDGRVM